MEALWEDETVKQGLLHLEYHLSERALEGSWVVEARGETKSFTIIKQLPPRFEVQVNSTAGIYVYAHGYYYQVCGTYPSGRPVKGIASIKLTIDPSRLQVQQQKAVGNLESSK